jgi:hypothetical protein
MIFFEFQDICFLFVANILLMKPLLYPVLAILAFSSICQAQTRATWGEEFKMHNGSTDLSILCADKSGEYLEESHSVSHVGLWAPHVRKSATLVKLTPALSEQYRNDFDKELRGKQFEHFLFIGDKLYLFASDYSKHDYTTTLYAAEVDKNTGNLKQAWRSVHQWQKGAKSEDLVFRIAPNSDSSRVILTASDEGKGSNSYELQALDIDLKPLGNSVTITNEFDPKTFQVEDFVYTSSGNAVVVGRVYEYEEGKRKKDKNLQFKTYSIRIYDAEGKPVKDVATDIDGKFLVTSKVVQLKNELVLAAFYSNTKKKKEINGMLIQRIDPATGNILVSAQKELNASSISQVDDDEEKKEDKRNADDEDGLTANLRFNKFYITADNALIVLAESYQQRVQTVNSYGAGEHAVNTSETYMVYDCGDVYMSRISAQGNIDWLHVVPKSQTEILEIGSGIGTGSVGGIGGGMAYSYYFSDSWNYPFFAGFGSIQGDKQVHIFFNDYDKNAGVLEPGQHIKKVHSYGKTSCYEICLDVVTGKYTKKEVFSNKDIPNAMPRLGVEMSDALYMTGKEGKHIAVGKLVCKD